MCEHDWMLGLELKLVQWWYCVLYCGLGCTMVVLDYILVVMGCTMVVLVCKMWYCVVLVVQW